MLSGKAASKKQQQQQQHAKNASSRSTIDIYVDPSHDPDIGEIVVVRKKKSRAGLDKIGWALGDVTNNEEVEEKEEKVKIKMEEKEKWWSIGRGRKDSKGAKDTLNVPAQTNSTMSKFKLRPKGEYPYSVYYLY